MIKRLLLIGLAISIIACSESEPPKAAAAPEPQTLGLNTPVLSILFHEQFAEADVFEAYNIDNFIAIEETYVSDNLLKVTVEYDVVFKIGLRQLESRLRKEPRRSTHDKVLVALEVYALRKSFGIFDAGQRMHRSETLELVKQNNSWVLETRTPIQFTDEDFEV